VSDSPAQDPLDETSCSICGRPLGYNPEDQPDWPTGPMCGDCYQSREMDNDIWAADMLSDDLDEHADDDQ
jgi:hypothetical protein